MRIELCRNPSDNKQTLGVLYLLNDNYNVIDSWYSLELPWKNNQRRISCIPKGNYKAIKHKSPKFGLSLWLQNVPNRSEILIHKGNYHTDILGCILIGKGKSDINNDGYLDVTSSRLAVSELMKYLRYVMSINVEVK
jgi:hypothetical protein